VKRLSEFRSVLSARGHSVVIAMRESEEAEMIVKYQSLHTAVLY